MIILASCAMEERTDDLKVHDVDDDLKVHEDFFGFYEVDNIKSDTIVAAIKDSLLRFNLSLDSCRGQIYDGASNMLDKKSVLLRNHQLYNPKLFLHTALDTQ